MCFVLIGSNIFWAIVCNRLVNKLMSRNFGEYLQAKNVAPKKKKTQKLELDPVYIKEEQRIADNANTMLGLI